MQDISIIIANNLTYLRKKNGLTQQKLANAIGYSDNAVSRWERGEATPAIETLDIIAKYFGIKVSDLLDENLILTEDEQPSGARVQRILVVLFSVSVVWMVAVIAYFYLKMYTEQIGKFGEHPWLVFIMGVPVSMLLICYFNKHWGNQILNVIFFSVFWWSLLATIYLIVLMMTGTNLWPLFLLGIPIQLAQLLWYFIRVGK